MSNARSIGKVTVTFGLVSIPAKLFAATSDAEKIQFNLLGPDGSRLKQQYVDGKGQVVEREQMRKGFEFAKDQYVIFDAAELKAMEEAGTHCAEIAEFVPAEAVDPIYFSKPYFLAPDVGGNKPYALLASALRETGRCAIARWAARGKMHVVMIRAVDAGLVMQQLLYSTEVRALADLGIAPAEVKEAELKLAIQLVDAQSSEAFDAKQYVDEVRARIAGAIEKKIAGEAITLTSAAAPTAQVIDLTAALQASLEAGAAKKKAAGEPKSAKKKAA